jgi:hypothetical protein
VPVAIIAIFLPATRPPAFLRDSGETYKDAFYSSLTTSTDDVASSNYPVFKGPATL